MTKRENSLSIPSLLFSRMNIIQPLPFLVFCFVFHTKELNMPFIAEKMLDHLRYLIILAAPFMLIVRIAVLAQLKVHLVFCVLEQPGRCFSLCAKTEVKPTGLTMRSTVTIASGSRLIRDANPLLASMPFPTPWIRKSKQAEKEMWRRGE